MAEHHDEDTLRKVYDALRRGGINASQAQDIIMDMQNHGLLFREHKKEKFADCHTLEELVFQALGAASICWDNPGPLGQFDSTQAKEIGDEVVERIRKMYEYDKDVKMDGALDDGPREGGMGLDIDDGERHDKQNKTCTCSPITITFSATCKDVIQSERVLESFPRLAAEMAQDDIPVSINLYNLND